MTAPKPVPSATDVSAKDAITTFLGTYGLSGLGTFAWNEYLKGVPLSQIMLDIRKTPAYTQRFPGMAELAKTGRAISEQQYMNQEDAYRQVLHSYGLPRNFYDKPDDFAKFMVGDVSPSELNDRVKQYTSVVMGDTETLHQLTSLYGKVGHSNNPQGDLLAHYLDPNTAAPLLTEQLNAAQFAAAGKTSGYGQLSAAQAMQFGAQQQTSVSQAQQGFGTLVHDKELFGALPGEGQQNISETVQLGAAFGGDAAGQEQIANRAKLRVAEGSGGGGFSATQTGLKGTASNEV